MEIGKPTKTIYMPGKCERGKYNEIYKSLGSLKTDEWLPVTFPTAHEAYNFRVAASTYRGQRIEAKLRGEVVYVRLKAAKAAKNGKVGR